MRLSPIIGQSGGYSERRNRFANQPAEPLSTRPISSEVADIPTLGQVL